MSEMNIWGDYETLNSGEAYIDSLRGRELDVYLFGELVEEPPCDCSI